MRGKGPVERVLVFGIGAVILTIVGIAIWGATGAGGASPEAARDGGAVGRSPSAPNATPKVIRDLQKKQAEVARQREAQLRELMGDAEPVAKAAEVPELGKSFPVAPQQPIALKSNGPVEQGPEPKPVSEPKAEPSALPEAYTIQSGDSIWKVARRFYGDGDVARMVDVILEANPDIDADLLQIGDVVKLPPKMPEGVQTKPLAEQTDQRLYEVREGDTLGGIAQRELGSEALWTKIYEANRDRLQDPSRIYPGMTLRLPPR